MHNVERRDSREGEHFLIVHYIEPPLRGIGARGNNRGKSTTNHVHYMAPNKKQKWAKIRIDLTKKSPGRFLNSESVSSFVSDSTTTTTATTTRE